LAANPPPRIAYLVSQYPAVNHTFIMREILELRRIGFEVRVASIRGPDRPFDRLTVEEQQEQSSTFYIKPGGAALALTAHLRMLTTRPLGYARTLGCAFRLAGMNLRVLWLNLLYFAEAVVFADWMKRTYVTHVHMHFTTTVGLLASRLLPMITSATIHGPDEFTDPAGFHLPEKAATFDLLCTISDYGRSQLMRFSDAAHWNKFHVSRLGVDPTRFAARPARDNPSPLEILFVGRLARVKAPHILIAALDNLIRQGRDVRLRLIGDGPERAGLEQDVAQRGLSARVIFEGSQNGDRVLEFYRQTDIFALPSFAEGIPVVLMEAMSMEIPCVSTWITGVPELIRDGVDGLLVTPSSTDSLAEALRRLVDDPALRSRLGSAARRRVMESYDLSRNTAGLAGLLRETGHQAKFP
jgi:glycosyltransferase involved in cell wall biosynthesis